jgi:hypothetical protein
MLGHLPMLDEIGTTKQVSSFGFWLRKFHQVSPFLASKMLQTPWVNCGLPSWTAR